MMFFLSKGYFRSRNCLKEIRATIVFKKPLVLVHEADPGKGGLTLDASKEECPEVRAARGDPPRCHVLLLPWPHVISSTHRPSPLSSSDAVMRRSCAPRSSRTASTLWTRPG